MKFYYKKNLRISKFFCNFAAGFKSNGHFGNVDYKFISYAIF